MSNKKIFAVLNTRGCHWDDSKPMEEQGDWRAHADFMNGLLAEGFVMLGGPLAGTRNVLLIVLESDVFQGNNPMERRLIKNLCSKKIGTKPRLILTINYFD